MAPDRPRDRPLKRQKTNPTEERRSQSSSQDQIQQAAKVPLPPDTPATASPEASAPKEEQRSSWLARTWPRKTPPLTQTSPESVSSTSNTSPTTAAPAPPEAPARPKGRLKAKRSQSLAMTLGKSTSNRPEPINAVPTIVHATSEGVTSLGKGSSWSGLSSRPKEIATADTPAIKEEQQPGQVDNTVQPAPVTAPAPEVPQPDHAQQTQPESQSLWRSWLPGQKDGTAAKPSEAQETPPRAKPVEEPASSPTIIPPSESAKSQPEMTEQVAAPSATANNKRSWYQTWSSGEPASETATPRTASVSSNPAQSTATDGIPSGKTTSETTKHLGIPQANTPKSRDISQASSLETAPPPPLPGDGSKSGWAFWSREKRRPESVKSETEPRVGEIAISDTPSQARPKRASISLQDNSTKPVLKPSPQELLTKRAPTQRVVEPKQQPASKPTLPSEPQDKSTTKDSLRTQKASSSNATAVSQTPRPASPAPSVDKKKEGQNLLLPPLHDTLSYEEQPSLLERLTRLLYYTKEPTADQHLSLARDPPRIKHALAIGVHGYFPGPMVQRILGQPTGTSIKFAEKAAQNIRRYVASQGYDCEVKTAALEGEGRIAERVELLWKLLLNWIDEIRRSDFILIAAHSQGVPVAIMLVAKLIHFGCLGPSARVGICAMAGVNMGPFQDYKSSWISGTAAELWEFTDPNSKVSTDYMAAMAASLHFGVKVTFVGSIDDQLVSMESSVFAPLTHPHIYRAVSIDSRIHAPNFLSNLVGFVLKLRNVGVPDHGLIRELSTPLAGSLYTGEGHSRLHEDDAVYTLAITFALETTSLPGQSISSSKRAPLSAADGKATPTSTSGAASASLGANPYILPFAMRGILEEDVVKKELRDEAKQLLEQFDRWEPKTKVLKDVKFRLEGVRMQLL